MHSFLFSAATIAAALFSAEGQNLDFVTANSLQVASAAAGSSPALMALVNDANSALSKGPFTVTTSAIVPPSGNVHDYYSWAPYWWPSCASVTDPNPQHDCQYVREDGKVNPDVTQLNDISTFNSMAKAVSSLTKAYVVTKNEQYAAKAASLIQTFFLDPSTSMNPSASYSQVVRGPGQWTGRAEGLLDMRFLIHVANGAQLLKGSQSWTSSLDAGLQYWFGQYVQWALTSAEGQQEGAAPNNHGSYEAAQIAAYWYYLGQIQQAQGVIQTFLSGAFQGQIDANGEQPLEAARTRPFHYRAFNLQALIVLGKIGSAVGVDVWNAKTAAGSTIQTAVNYLITLNPGFEDATLAAPVVLAAAQVYGSSASYTAAAASFDPNYASEAYALWNAPGVPLAKRAIRVDRELRF